MDDKQITPIKEKIFSLRGFNVILDQDLAKLYKVETSALNQAVSRNLKRFPKNFSFLIDNKELKNLISQNVISSSSHGGRRKPPRVFTEHGALMASTILRSQQATKMSLFIINAFIKMREEFTLNHEILKRLAEIDKTLITHDTALYDIYQKLIPLLSLPPMKAKRKIGFDNEL